MDCVIRWTGRSWNDPEGVYTIQRVNEGEVFTSNPNSIVFTSSMKKLRNLHCNIFFIGQNGGFSDYDDLVNQYKKIVDFSGNSDYIIIGLHKQSSVTNLKILEQKMITEFGSRFINLREYLATKALKDLNLTPSEDDLNAMENGQCPPQLLRDAVHFNSNGNQVIANVVFQRLSNLGIVE